MPSSPDTLRELLTKFSSMITASESTVLDLTLLDGRGSCNPSEISSTIWLLLCNQVRLYLSYNKYFLVAYGLLRTRTFIYAGFTSHRKWSNAQCVSTPTTTIIPATTGTNYCLDFFGHVIYPLQSNTYQNIPKLLTHPSWINISIFFIQFSDHFSIIISLFR